VIGNRVFVHDMCTFISEINNNYGVEASFEIQNGSDKIYLLELQ